MEVAEGWPVARGCITRHQTSIDYPASVYTTCGVRVGGCGQNETKPESADTKDIDRHRAERPMFAMQFITNHESQYRRGDRSVAAPRAKWEAHES
ncbi:hypothetical protein E4U45_005808 [Claviceps purpurea]|nr:hypothetical protein E4U45_005808 [Claviceps purpurea]